MPDIPTALTIAGSDSGGGAGIQADLATFAACGAHGTSAITCLTAQNPDGVSGVHPTPAAFVREQAEQVAAYFAVGAVKSGMLPTADIVRATADFLNSRPEIPYILDPVMVASSGARLIDTEATMEITRRLIPRAALVTPNLDEAAVLLGREIASTPEGRKSDARELATRFGAPMLIKGGHAADDELTDLLFFPNGDTEEFHTIRIRGVDTHGSGCTLSAAIAAHIARGKNLRDAVAEAHAFLQRGLREPVSVGGRRFIARRA